MIEEIRLPEISENVETGDVVKILVSVGDVVTVDQPLIELETEKAVFEVPSTVSGTVSEIAVGVGDEVKVGQVIARIDSEKAARAPAGEATAADAPPSSVKTAPKAPVAREPVSMSPAADHDRDVVQEMAATITEEVRRSEEPAPASPTVRRLARELGIDIHRVGGTGNGGRITAEDVHNFAKAIIKGAPGGAHAVAPVAGAALPDFTRWGEVERTPMSKVRQVTARNMATAWSTVPHVTQHDEADITELEDTRKRYGKALEAAGGKLTMTAILLKVAAGALHRFPDFNASVDVAASEIVHKKYINIGVAVDTERGLLVPVIRNVDRKNIVELSVELSNAAARARDKKIKPDELEGGNFTISNLGGIGGTSFTPIVYAPEVAILGVSRGKMQPILTSGVFEPRLMLPLSLSYDHRVIDGAAAARFLRWVAEALEDPILLALEG